MIDREGNLHDDSPRPKLELVICLRGRVDVTPQNATRTVKERG
jgi:hypothetical protein